MIKILFICHGRAGKIWGKRRRIGVFGDWRGKTTCVSPVYIFQIRLWEKMSVGSGKVMDKWGWLSHFYIIFDDSRCSGYSINKMDRYK